MTTQPALSMALPNAAVSRFGTELVLNLAGCLPIVIASPDELTSWTALLAEKIGMVTYGEPLVCHFGDGALAGWTVVQLITTSNINVHAVSADNSAFVNVFSCRPFDTEAATTFTVDFFGARAHTGQVIVRETPRLQATESAR